MMKLIFRDLFIYQGKNLFVLPFFTLSIIYMMQIFGENTSFSLMIITISLFALTMAAQLTFNCDEISKFNRFLRAAPVSAKTIVISRYASCLLSAVIGVLSLFVSALLMNMASVIYPSLWRNITVNADILLVCVISLILICALLFPLLFKFGYTKTKYPLMLLIIVIGSSTPMLISDTANQGFINSLSSMSTGGYFIIAIFSLLVLYGSTILSTAILKGKEI